MIGLWIDVVLETLFITNIWIFLYTHLLIFLNTHFPQKINESFLWIQPKPEPFEIPLYLLLTAFFVAIIWLFGNFFRQKIQKIPANIKIVFILILAFFFFWSIGGYPMAHQFDPYPPRPDGAIYMLVTMLYIVGALLILSFCLLLTRLITNKKIQAAFLFGFVGIVIALLTFDAGFPMAGHDYEYFIGPAWEVVMGKTIYTQILSRYAFLTIEFFAFLQKIGISLFYIPFFIWISYIVEYLLCFYLINKISKSAPFSFLGTASIITISYFSLSHLPSVIPQVGALRWLPMIVLLFFFYRFKKINSLPFIAIVTISSFFVIDVGVAIIMTYLTSLLIFYLMHQVYPSYAGLSRLAGSKQLRGSYTRANSFASGINIQSLIKSVLALFVFLLLFFFLINLIHILTGYQSVELLSALYSLQKHATLGLSLIPIAMRTYFWLVLLIYFATIVYFFRDIKQTLDAGKLKLDLEDRNSKIEYNQTSSIVLFSANLSLFASVYFVGRSHPHNLFHISLFPLLTLFLVCGALYQNISSQKKKLIIIFTLFLALIVYPAYQRRFTLTEMIVTKLDRLKGRNIFAAEVSNIIDQSYREEIVLIKNEIPAKDALILSVDDAYLFVKTGKKNLLDANPIMGLDLPEDLDFALKTAVKKCPAKIAVDCSYIGKCSPYTPFIGVTFNIRLLLDKLERACKVTYEPAICTNKLCIANKKVR